MGWVQLGLEGWFGLQVGCGLIVGGDEIVAQETKDCSLLEAATLSAKLVLDFPVAAQTRPTALLTVERPVEEPWRKAEAEPQPVEHTSRDGYTHGETVPVVEKAEPGEVPSSGAAATT